MGILKVVHHSPGGKQDRAVRAHRIMVSLLTHRNQRVNPIQIGVREDFRGIFQSYSAVGGQVYNVSFWYYVRQASPGGGSGNVRLSVTMN